MNIPEKLSADFEHLPEVAKSDGPQELPEENSVTLEQQELRKVALAEELVSTMESSGLSIPQENRKKMIAVMTSVEFLRADSKEFLKLTGVDKVGSGVMRNLTESWRVNEKEYLEKLHELLRIHLSSPEYEEMIDPSSMTLVTRGSASMGEETVDLAGLSDAEVIEDLQDQELAGVVRNILHDREAFARFGYHWNVLIPTNSPYVFKAPRGGYDDKDVSETRREILFSYPIIKKVLGEEFLLRQAVLKSKNDEFYILQEKILSQDIGMGDSREENFWGEPEGKRIIRSLEDEENRKTLQRFLDGAERLLKQNNMTVDLVGDDNIFFRISESNKLTIKLADYGWRLEEIVSDRNTLEESYAVVGKLKSLLVNRGQKHMYIMVPVI